MYREGFQKNPLKLVWGENKAAREESEKLNENNNIENSK